ncbi:hypothetical protein CSB93_4341 [Pseudomonas paraeruginosa]|uniref:Uncharacterized protein n=1 Tax=Pseudomonas paraeruginosa TaxID=2994495 RepID=A0A2R3IV26_9PSED|nr:hypothetical protein CSB93_4341 [Pseudomonas paraeruginosa]AWE95049.1 hypothetical protein CSC28_3132 [Pseudomonas paraeruginosa]
MSCDEKFISRFKAFRLPEYAGRRPPRVTPARPARVQECTLQ